MADIEPRWRRPGDPSAEDHRALSRRSIRAWGWLTGLIASLCLLLWLAAWYRPSPTPMFIPLLVSEYESPFIPPPASAAGDWEALAVGGPWARRDAPPPRNPSRRDLDRELGRLSLATPEEVVVVYLGGVALVTPEGRVALLPSDAQLDRPGGWLPLRAVLEALRSCRSRRKLLVLDTLGPPPPEATLLFPADVSTRIDEEVSQVADPWRLVLCPCAPGQVSTASDGRPRSTFVEYLVRGLSGEADGSGDSGAFDRRVSALELADLLAAKVDAWAVRNRGVRQTPRMLGRRPGFDFTLSSPRSGPAAPASPPAPTAYPDWLLEGWRVRDSLADRGAHRPAPREFRRLEAVLLHAEAAWRGGADAARVRTWAEAEAAALRRRIERAGATPAPPPSSLAQERAAGRVPSEKFAGVWDTTLAALKTAAAAKPGDEARGRAEALDTLVGAAGGLHGADVAAAAWRSALDPGLDRDRLYFIRDFLARSQPAPEYVETSWLARIAGAEASEAPPPIDLVRRSLRLASLGEVAYVRPRSIVPARPLLDAAAQARHDAEVLLRSAGFVSSAGVGPALGRAEASLSALVARQDAIEEARARVEDALVLVQDARPEIDRRPDLEPTWKSTLREAAVVSRLLAALQDSPPGAGRQLGPLRNRSALLKNRLDDLRSSYLHGPLSRLAEAASAADSPPALLSTIEGRLASVLPRAEDRALLWRTLRASESAGDAESPPPATDPAGPPVEASRRRASLALLRFPGLEGAGVPEATDLFGAWTVDFSRQFDAKPSSAGDRWRGEQRSRVAPPALPHERLDDPEASPIGVLRRSEASLVWAWLLDHDLYEAVDPAPSPFFAVAADALRPFVGPGIVERPRVEFTAPARPLDLSGGVAGSLDLGLRIAGDPPRDGPLEVSILDAADAWMRLRVARPGAGDSARITGEAATDPARFATPAPEGLLVAARLAGRTFHAAVPVKLPGAIDSVAVRLRRSAVPRDGPLEAVALRPNQPAEPYFLSLENPTPIALEPLAALEDAEGRRLSEPVAVPLPPRSSASMPIRLAGGGAAAGSQASATPDVPFRRPLRVVLRDPARPGSSPAVHTLPVRVLRPSDYVEILYARYLPASPSRRRNRLEVAVRGTGLGRGAAPTVELLLDPARSQGLLPPESGTLRATLAEDGSPAVLFAEGLRFADGMESEASTFALAVDGDPRGFELRTAFPRENGPITPRTVEGVRLALEAPRAAPSGTLKVRVGGVDAPEDSTIELELVQDGDALASPDARLRLSGPRDLEPHITPLKAEAASPGGFGLSARQGDWSVELPADRIEGRRLLRARLLGPSGTLLAEATRPIVLERRPPSGIAILGAPEEAVKGSTLSLEAVGEESPSGIAAVDFFLGPPPADGATLAASKLISARRAGSGPWAADVKLPRVAGPLEVGVRFVSRAGLAAYGSTRVDVVDAVAPPPGRVVGRVAEGDRLQAGLEINLVDGSGATVLTTISEVGGRFAFEGVKPGKYRVRAAKLDSGSRAESDPIDVKPGATAQVVLDLLL